MKENINFQLKMDKILESINEEKKKIGYVPKLLLHACCAPCSSYVLEYLSNHFEITIFYYNPNISENAEYNKRVEELKRLISEMNTVYPVSFIEGEYEPDVYDKAIEGLETLGERSKRCYVCYELRLDKTAQIAKEGNFDYFTTTLSISPHKNATWLNEIGERLSEGVGVPYLYSDFKKKNGYKRSIELSAKYHLYRQDYCGCKYSKEEARLRNESR
ncbi:MAG: epoxyqueuosine reductase QueH [Lachnospiraceae bacterium]|nr:epoxyqueuosine reductase QueH [Lachnospiraceae bacterium]